MANAVFPIAPEKSAGRMGAVASADSASKGIHAPTPASAVHLKIVETRNVVLMILAVHVAHAGPSGNALTANALVNRTVMEKAVAVTGAAEAVDAARAPWTVLKGNVLRGIHVEDAPMGLNVKMGGDANGQQLPIVWMS